jgi:hypothetical protein
VDAQPLAKLQGETIPVLEVPRGWIPQGPVQPTTLWWHMGLRATSQFIGNSAGGLQQTLNLAKAGSHQQPWHGAWVAKATP